LPGFGCCSVLQDLYDNASSIGAFAELRDEI